MRNGKTLRDEGIRNAEEHADDAWKDDAYAAVEELCRTKRTFTSDDVWERVPSKTHENRAMGGVMMRARADGLIRPLDLWKQTTRASSHCRPVRVWEVI